MRAFVGVVCVIVLARWCLAEDAAPRVAPGTDALQAAVLRDGFLVLDSRGDRHVVKLDHDGHRRARLAVPVTTDARVFGTSAGPGVGYLRGKKVELALITGDGTLGKPSTWGRSVLRLCDGVATNDQRFGVGWIERDGRVWVVHGPTRNALLAVASPLAEAAARGNREWCAVASAGDHLALFWREGTRLFLNMCNVKGCLDVVRVPVDKKDELLGVGCLVHGCLIALRDPQGKARIGWMSDKGKVGWVKPLPAAAQSEVAIIGAGTRALAVAFVSPEGAQVVRVSREGSMARAWADPSATTIPAIAWSRDHLLVATRERGGVATEVVALPE